MGGGPGYAVGAVDASHGGGHHGRDHRNRIHPIPVLGFHTSRVLINRG